MSTQTDKIREALERISKVIPSTPEDRYGDGGTLQRAKVLATEALAALSELESQPSELESQPSEPRLTEDEIQQMASSWADHECGIGVERKFKDDEQRDWWYTELGRTMQILKFFRARLTKAAQP